MSSSESTPTPWTFYRDEDGHVVAIVNDHENLSKRRVIVGPSIGNNRSDAENDANAAFIVKAVNSYEANQALIAKLTDALEGMTDMYAELVNSGDCGFWDPEENAAVKVARAALSLAKSETPQ